MTKYKLKDIRDTMGQSEEIYHAPEVDKEIEPLMDYKKAYEAIRDIVDGYNVASEYKDIGPISDYMEGVCTIIDNTESKKEVVIC